MGSFFVLFLSIGLVANTAEAIFLGPMSPLANNAVLARAAEVTDQEWNEENLSTGTTTILAARLTMQPPRDEGRWVALAKELFREMTAAYLDEHIAAGFEMQIETGSFEEKDVNKTVKALVIGGQVRSAEADKLQRLSTQTWDILRLMGRLSDLHTLRISADVYDEATGTPKRVEAHVYINEQSGQSILIFVAQGIR